MGRIIYLLFELRRNFCQQKGRSFAVYLLLPLKRERRLTFWSFFPKFLSFSNCARSSRVLLELTPHHLYSTISTFYLLFRIEFVLRFLQSHLSDSDWPNFSRRVAARLSTSPQSRRFAPLQFFSLRVVSRLSTSFQSRRIALLPFFYTSRFATLDKFKVSALRAFTIFF